MNILADLKMYGRFAWGLRGFLHKTINLDDARRTVQQLLAERENNFLRLVERGIFGYERSPYLPLLEMAGCELGDIRGMLRKSGLEETLKSLREAGVYVTFEEFKGRKPIVRDGEVFQVHEHSFDNPYLKTHYYSESGGSTGAGTRIPHELDHLAVLSAHELITYRAHGVVDMPKVIWRGVLPDGSGIYNTLKFFHWGRSLQKWFSPFNPYDMDPSVLKYRLATLFTIIIARLVGVRIPWPQEVKVEQADIVARWTFDALSKHGTCLVLAPASRALRVCVAAREAGLDLTGAIFRIAGEPISSAKVRGIRRSGAEVFTTYGFAELGRIGMGCSRPIDASDVHLCKSICAMIPHHRLVPDTDISVQAFTFTSLLPTAPKILLNTESDDYGVIESRTCGCPLEDLGLTEHLREIRSFQKLTGEGVSLVASEMVNILEEMLPARFGGSPLDYQLLEEEDEDGFTRINLLVHPRLKIRDNREVVDVVLSAMRKSSAMADAARNIWAQSDTFQVLREKPVWTGRGKLMSLYSTKRHQHIS